MGKDIKKSVYLVTRGEYSDYRVVGAYSTRKLAEDYYSRRSSGDEYGNYQIEEYPLDCEDEEVPYICVHLKDSGDVAYEGKALKVTFSLPDRLNEEMQDIKFYGGNMWRYYTWVQTDDRVRAVKVATERLMRYKVENNI